MPAYRNHLNNAFAVAANQQFPMYLQAIALCSQMKPVDQCLPGQSGVPELKRSTSYATMEVYLDNRDLLMTLTLSGPYERQVLSYRYEGSSRWIVGCENQGVEDPDLCEAEAFIASPYWRASQLEL